jgi:hypothetical protein
VSISSGRIKIQANNTTNVSMPGFAFLMRDTAGVPRTGLSVTGFRSIDGAAFSSCANAVSELSNGWYVIDLDASDLNGADISLRFTATGAQDAPFKILMVP